MDKKRTLFSLFKNRNASKLKEIKTELDFQRGKIIARKLRKVAGASQERKNLKKMLYEYEQRVWADVDSVTDEQIIESDKAEAQAEQELLN